MKKQMLFIKMFIWISFLVFILTLVTTVVFFERNNRSENEMNNNRNNRFIEQTGERIDYKLSVAFNLINKLRLNDKVHKFAHEKEYYYYNVTQVNMELQKDLTAFGDLHYDIAVTKKDDKLFISSTGTSDYNDYYEYLGINSNQLRNLEKFLRNPNAKSPFVFQTVLNDERNTPALVMVSKERVFPNGEIILYLTFNSDYLLPDPEEYGYESIVIYDGEEVFSSEYENTSKELYEHITIDELGAHSGDASFAPILIKHSNKTYSIYYKKSNAQKNWYYIIITTTDSYLNSIKELMGYYAIVWMGIALIGIFISFVVAKRTYRPIKNIVNQFRIYGETSMKDDIHFISDSVSRIHKINEEFQEIINSNRIPLKTKFLKELCQGLLPSDEILADIGKYGLDMYSGKWITCIIDFSENKEIENLFSKDAIIRIKAQISQFIKEQMDKKIPNEIFEFDYSRYIIMMQESNINIVKKELNSILSIIELNFEVKVIAAIGNPIEKIERISESVMSAASILDGRTVFDNRMVLCMDDIISSSKAQTYYYPLDMESNLLHYTVTGKKDEALAVLDYVLEENMVRRNISKEDLNTFIFALVTTINRILQKTNKKIEDFYGEGSVIYLELKIYGSIQETKEKIRGIFNNIIGSVYIQSEAEDLSFTEKMISYVHTHYMKEITLLDLAQDFNMSIGYIGKAFKKYTGENFKDYLSIYRVKMAIEILKTEKDLKIKELAWMVGCNNANTFIRMFKRYEGISPGQYLGREV